MLKKTLLKKNTVEKFVTLGNLKIVCRVRLFVAVEIKGHFQYCVLSLHFQEIDS